MYFSIEMHIITARYGPVLLVIICYSHPLSSGSIIIVTKTSDGTCTYYYVAHDRAIRPCPVSLFMLIASSLEWGIKVCYHEKLWCMYSSYVCMAITSSGLGVDREWLPIRRVFSRTGKITFSLSLYAPDNLVTRDRFVRPSYPASAWSFSTLRLNLVLTHGVPTAFHGGVHLLTPPMVIGSVSSLSGHTIAYRWRSLPRVRRHKASSLQDISSNLCCNSGLARRTILCASLFPHPLVQHQVTSRFLACSCLCFGVPAWRLIMQVPGITGGFSTTS